LHPRPRDFSRGKFLVVSTDNRVPTDEDLFQTISRGMPGSAMPSWAHLPEQDRRDLVRYVRALTHRGKVLRLMGDQRGAVAAGFEEELAAGPLSPEDAEETAAYLLEVGAPLELPAAVSLSDDLSKQGQET
jgi:mono/diheme cytochrome c family protein